MEKIVIGINGFEFFFTAAVIIVTCICMRTVIQRRQATRLMSIIVVFGIFAVTRFIGWLASELIYLFFVDDLELTGYHYPQLILIVAMIVILTVAFNERHKITSTTQTQYVK